MAKLSTKSKSKTHRVIIFGAPKAGKSLLAAQLAEHYKLFWVDMENGHETLFQLPEAWQENVELINLPDTKTYPIAAETALKMVKGKVSICDAHGKVGCMLCKKDQKLAEEKLTEKADLTDNYFVSVDLPNMGHEMVVVFDSLTQLTASFIAQITKNEPDDYKMKTDDWGQLAKLIDIFLSHIQQAGYNVIVISHEVEAETEGKKNTLVPVGGSRNSSRNVAKYFDHVIYAERKNKKHVFSSSTTTSTTILTGSRTGARLEDSDDGSLLQIFKPELYEDGKNSVAPKVIGKTTTATAKAVSTETKATGSVTAKENVGDLLARLRANKK